MKTIIIILLSVVSIFGQVKDRLTATIASGDTISSAIYIGYNASIWIIFPSAMTGTTLSIYTSNIANGYNQIPSSKVYGLQRYIKLVSSSAEASSRTLTVTLRPVNE